MAYDSRGMGDFLFGDTPDHKQPWICTCAYMRHDDKLLGTGHGFHYAKREQGVCNNILLDAANRKILAASCIKDVCTRINRITWNCGNDGLL